MKPAPWVRAAAFVVTGWLAALWPAQAQPLELPFRQTLDLQLLREAVQAPVPQLLAIFARQGVGVRRLASADPSRPPNPLLTGLPLADADLVRRAEMLDSYEGRLVCSRDEGCPAGRDTVLIRDNASCWTLLHEFVHSQLRPLQRVDSDEAIELRFGAAHRRLTLYQRRLLDDPYRLLDPRWRRDILQAQLDVARDLFERIRFGQSQEAIVEKLLARHIDDCSPHFDSDRRAEGRRYGEVMIDNAIDLFNAVHTSKVYVAETLRHLQRAIATGEIVPAPGEGVGAAELAAAAAGERELERLLNPVRAEIGRLKRFYEER